MPAALALAACDHKGEATSISITGENGSAGIVNGVASIDVQGVKGNITLPKFQIDASNMDIDGVKLFPGSTVGNVDVNARGEDDGRVRIAFESPASVDKVRGHFRSEFAKAGFKAADDGAGLKGTTDEGKPFRLTLDAAGADRVKGELTLGN